MEFVAVPKAKAGDKVAVLSPSFAIPAVAPAIHDQAMERLRSVTGLEPVEYPTTRQRGASAADRARDITQAFRDPEIRAIVTTIGGEDQITVVPHVDLDAVRHDPKPFLGYSDNTNMLNWLWTHGVPAFYGGSTQVHIGPGPGLDPVHEQSLRAALLTGGQLEVVDPGESEDHGIDWTDPRSLSELGDREPTEPWTWAGTSTSVTGRTWGGAVEVLQWILSAGRFPADPDVLEGTILLVETSELMIPAHEFGWILRSMGERGLLEAVSGVIVARPPTSDHTHHPSADERASMRNAQRDAAINVISRYNPSVPIVIGPPFGHTRPQWILPYGGYVSIDAPAQRLFADYS